MSPPGPTRRELVATLAASAVPVASTAQARAQPVGDQEVVLGLLALEQRSVLVYEQLVQGAKPSGPTVAAAKLFRRQERRHVEALTEALRGMGATSLPKAPSPQEPRGDSVDLIRLAAEHEVKCIRAYYEATAKLRSPALLATAAGVMANEAQHLAVLRQLLGGDPSPVAFVTGRG
ncbi:MAG: ferritin-like domain-containing protein [Actinomycetota bacterium]|nr:ferritin-like domain-containing protein [Actinomycetota bacterium]